MSRAKFAASMGLALMLSACASTPSLAPAPRAPAASTPVFRAPTVMRSTGLDSIIGTDSRALLNRFGTARIDLAEGDARKLQFTSDACVLDIYLYPMRADQEPVATHIETRRRADGASTDNTGCIADVERNRR